MTLADTAKRILDVMVAALMLLAALPLILVSAVAAGVSLRAWPFFWHYRVGRGGELFRLIKLRTLPPATPHYANKYQISELPIPRLCLALRRFHIDELPQLLLVITGRMSLVGPRPEMPPLHAALEPAFAAARTSVRPGCTGLWQVSNHCQELIPEHPEFDMVYLQHRSLRLDVWIAWHTVTQMLVPARRRRLVTAAQVPQWAKRVVPLPVSRHITVDEVALRSADAASA
ncbi:MAG: hypothetical protein QOI95_3450 [Acidimicrobiaceae bacterium]|jgi:lipopolysaccharide/colanic/teichoic acid biosynthesis glycosyltransferase